jgi:hypothetical protein
VGHAPETPDTHTFWPAASRADARPHPRGSSGVLRSGPVQAGLYSWWQVDYASGVDGWSAESYLLPHFGPVTAPQTSSALAVGSRVATTASVNVRSTPSTSGAILNTEFHGMTGEIVAGPTTADGHTWWQVKYDYDVTGWTAGEFLTPGRY